MTSRDFCYWLQGFFEINGTDAPLSKKQTKMIQKHLNMVFLHEIDPSFGKNKTKLLDIHEEAHKRGGVRVDPHHIRLGC